MLLERQNCPLKNYDSLCIHIKIVCCVHNDMLEKKLAPNELRVSNLNGIVLQGAEITTVIKIFNRHLRINEGSGEYLPIIVNNCIDQRSCPSAHITAAIPLTL